jgi:hypothetical protein
LAALPLAATVVAVFFAFRTGIAARRRRNPALAIWSFALVQFAVAAAALTWGVALGWSPALYRVFYLFGAVLNAAWLGLGTIWLLANRSIAWTAAAVLTILSVYAAVAVVRGDLVAGALTRSSIPAPAEVIAPGVRVLSRWFSIGGSVVVLGGLVFSMLARRRSQVVGLSMLAGGVVVVGLAGEMARSGRAGAFSALMAVGIGVMFLGFLRSS